MGLSKNEHLLLKASEECIEVSKEISKAIIFGLDDAHPYDAKTNKEKIQDELADLLGVVEMLIYKGILDKKEIFNEEKIQEKQKKVLKWMEYSVSLGITDA